MPAPPQAPRHPPPLPHAHRPAPPRGIFLHPAVEETLHNDDNDEGDLPSAGPVELVWLNLQRVPSEEDLDAPEERNRPAAAAYGWRESDATEDGGEYSPDDEDGRPRQAWARGNRRTARRPPTPAPTARHPAAFENPGQSPRAAAGSAALYALPGAYPDSDPALSWHSSSGGPVPVPVPASGAAAGTGWAPPPREDVTAAAAAAVAALRNPPNSPDEGQRRGVTRREGYDYDADDEDSSWDSLSTPSTPSPDRAREGPDAVPAARLRSERARLAQALLRAELRRSRQLLRLQRRFERRLAWAEGRGG
ncbi:hypothetical protein F4780DRAFT_775688 [Xylariomycetidae sp. FL0641]|nr:hypothetical protein F4780DRAFT_775688 [Xylariomycetidae sp. FL0641]